MKWLSSAVSSDGFLALFKPDNPIVEVPFLEAAESTAKKISEQYSDLKLCLSGGVDSEFVLRIFHKLDLAIEPVILRSEMNAIESNMAIRLCEELNVTPKIIELSIQEFFKLHINVVQDNQFRAILGATPHVIHSYVGGKIVTGYGDPSPLTENTAKYAALPEWDFYTSSLGDHPGAFFMYTPEIFLAYLNDIDQDLPVYEAKCKLYNLPYRQKIQYHPAIYQVQQRFNMRSKTFFEVPNDELQRLLRSGYPFSL